MLKCSDSSYYIGHTDDLEKRVAEHNAAKCAGYTSTRLPVTLVYAEAVASRYEALVAEHKIKKWSRKKKEALIAGDWSRISELCSRKKT